MAIRLAKRDKEHAEVHEINVTPFIDVMLVLLIIFMVAAPLATVDVPVNLPSASAEPPARPDKPIFVTFKADRSLAVSNEVVTRADLAAALDRRGEFLDADFELGNLIGDALIHGRLSHATGAAARRSGPVLW